MKKDNTGYHLKHLFIGSEGTLGFVTKVAVQCRPRPRSVHVAFLGLQNFDKVLKTFSTCKHDLDEILSAFEVMDAPTLQMSQEKLNLQSPIGEYPFYVLIETSGSHDDHDKEKLNKFLEKCLNTNLILNGTFTSEPTKLRVLLILILFGLSIIKPY